MFAVTTYDSQLVAVHRSLFLCLIGWRRRAQKGQFATLRGASDELSDRLKPADQGAKPHLPVPGEVWAE